MSVLLVQLMLLVVLYYTAPCTAQLDDATGTSDVMNTTTSLGDDDDDLLGLVPLPVVYASVAGLAAILVTAVCVVMTVVCLLRRRKRKRHAQDVDTKVRELLDVLDDTEGNKNTLTPSGQEVTGTPN